ncbi:MAG: nucleoside hydrolase [Myxococcota bacterium]
MQRIVVDTDLGVDDAAAVAWLCSQTERAVELIGVSAVWGNTSVEHVVANVHALLRALGRGNVPVVPGVARPTRRRPSRVGAIAHGPDGLWGASQGASALAPASTLVDFYGDIARAHPQSTLLALGPLTNLAALHRTDPALLRSFRKIVVLGGAKHRGSITPVSETNFWHDPDAAREVIAAGLPITLVTREAHHQCTMAPRDLDAIAASPGPAARFLAAPMRRYARATRAFGEAVSFPDVVAAMVATDPAVATEIKSALVRVIAADGLTRGQSIIGLTTTERLTMIDEGRALQSLIERLLTDPVADVKVVVADLLASEPDNTQVVLEVDRDRVRSSFLRAVTGREP